LRTNRFECVHAQNESIGEETNLYRNSQMFTDTHKTWIPSYTGYSINFEHINKRSTLR